MLAAVEHDRHLAAVIAGRCDNDAVDCTSLNRLSDRLVEEKEE
jgi:hypothetical protein